MSAFTLGDRYDWRGEKHGQWRRGKGALVIAPTRRGKVRPEYDTGRGPRAAMRDLRALLVADPLARDVFRRLAAT